MMHPIRILAPAEMGLYRAHLLRLSPEDRRLRFGHAIGDLAVREYVESLKLGRDTVLAHFGGDLGVIGAVHVAMCRGKHAEFAFSVEPPHRGHGLGAALFERAIVFARNRRARAAYVYCLAENRAMRRLARHVDMAMLTQGGESEGELALSPPTPVTLAREALAEHAGLCDYARKANRRAVQAVREGLRLAA